MRTKDMINEHEVMGGIQRNYKFFNGRGASVVRHAYSYGGAEGLWEVAVLDKRGRLDYSTSVTNDVIGRLTEAEVDAVLEQIEKLDLKRRRRNHAGH